MAKKTMGFRFSEATVLRLAELSRSWGCTRTAALERLVMGAELTTEQNLDEIGRQVEAAKSRKKIHDEVATAKDKIAEMRSPVRRQGIPKPDWKK